jgi:PAS domain S-box-containing protein
MLEPHFFEKYSERVNVFYGCLILKLDIIFFPELLSNTLHAYPFMLDADRLLNSILQVSHLGICVVDQRNYIVDVNDTFCTIYEYTKEELMGHSFSRLQPENYLERARLQYQNFVEGKQAQYQKRIQTRSGQQKVVYADVIQTEDPSGNLVKVYTLVEASAAAPQEVKQAPRKQVADQVNTGLMRISSEGELLYANAFARSLLYIPAGVRVLDNEVTHLGENGSRRIKLLTLLTEQRYLDNRELLVERPAHAPIWVLVSAAAVINESDQLCFDISLVNLEERKLNERKLNKKIDDLKAANKRLDHFVYGATHDLKAPLASLSGLLYIMRRETDPEQQTLFLDMMEKSIRRLNEFIREIVDYSRNANQVLRREAVEFRPLLEEIFESMEYMENAHKIRRILHVEQAAPFYTDLHRLKVVLNNLISNAHKYSSTHRRDCYIKVTVNASHEKATIRIEDNGQGIDKAHIEKIFDMFFRASEGKGGTGLGLYIVRETLEKMNGSIHVVSELGKGTSFVVTLPVISNPSQQKQLDLGI